MKGPAARDDDSMAVLLRGIKADIARLSARSTVPVGVGWRIEQRGPNLVAVLPGEDAEFVVASPGGECGKVLACLAGAMNGTLFYDDADRVAGVRISEDAGNGLRAGEDGGLFAGGGEETAGPPMVFSGPHLVAGVPEGQDIWISSDRDQYPGLWNFPDEGASHGLIFDAWENGDTTGMYYSTENADPVTGVSIRVPPRGWTSPVMDIPPGDFYAYFFLYPDNMVPDHVAWCSELEISFTAYFSGYPSSYHDPADGPGQYNHNDSMVIMDFYPGAAVILRSTGSVDAQAASGSDDTGDFARKGPYFGDEEWPVYPAIPGTYNDVPLHTLIKFRCRLRRDGTSAVYLYYGDTTKPEDQWDDIVPLGPVMNFDRLWWSTPMFQFGTDIQVRRLNRQYGQYSPVPSTPYPAMTFPEWWLSNISVTIWPGRLYHQDAADRARVDGGVITAGGSDAEGVIVTLTKAGETVPAQTTQTNAYGNYRFFSVPQGSWSVTARDGAKTVTRAFQFTGSSNVSVSQVALPP